MTIVEFNGIVDTSKNPEWLNNINEEISFEYIEAKYTIIGIKELFEFAFKQAEGWGHFANSLSSTYRQQLVSPYTVLRKQLAVFIAANKDSDVNTLKTSWQGVRQYIAPLRNTFTFDCPESIFLIAVLKEGNEVADGAYQYLLNNVTIRSVDSFRGALLAYEFKSKEKPLIVNRVESESVSIEQLKNEFREYISGSKEKVIELISESKKQIDVSHDDVNKKYLGYTKDIDNYANRKKEHVDKWFDATKINFEEFHKSSNTKIVELYKTYEELLRLKQPAEYWKLRATKLHKDGMVFLYVLVGLVLFACLSLYFLLWLTPDGMLLSFLKGPSAIKWSIVYVTFISFLAFGIKAVSKAMFSSFHLARDAEEREQLTYVYLALTKDKSVDEKDRTLIMQSLFSRADTGLLKEDSSPTMPSGIVEKFVK